MTIRGIRGPVSGGSILGRKTGRGRAQELTADDLSEMMSDAGSSSSSGGGSTANIQTLLNGLSTAQGALIFRDASVWAGLAPGTAGYALLSGGAGADPYWGVLSIGTVTSVGLELPSVFIVSGSPVTGAGTLTATLTTQTANYVWAGPASGAAAAPTFRALAAADIPALSYDASGAAAAALTAAETFSANASNISSGTVGVSYLPVATAATLGIAKPDDTTVTVTNGVLSSVSPVVGGSLLFTGPGVRVTTGDTGVSTAQIIGTLPLVNGDTPGPSFMADSVGQAVAVPLQGGVMPCTYIAAYLGAGLLSARPADPGVCPAATAFYYATDTGGLYVWSGSAWASI